MIDAFSACRFRATAASVPRRVPATTRCSSGCSSPRRSFRKWCASSSAVPSTYITCSSRSKWWTPVTHAPADVSTSPYRSRKRRGDMTGRPWRLSSGKCRRLPVTRQRGVAGKCNRQKHLVIGIGQTRGEGTRGDEHAVGFDLIEQRLDTLGGDAKCRAREHLAVLAKDACIVTGADRPDREQPHNVTGRTEGGDQAGYQDVRIQHDPHLVRARRTASISALMSSGDSRCVPAFSEAS